MAEPSKKRQAVPKPPPRPWRRASFSFDDGAAESEERDRDVSKGLEAIYLSGKKEDFKTMSHTRRSLAFRVAVASLAVCAVLSGLAWGGLLFYAPTESADAAGLTLALDGPDSVGLGKEETFTLRWENRTFQSLRDVHVKLATPPSMLVTGMQPLPSDQETKTWNMGTISSGAKGEIRFKGVFLGGVGEESALQAVATYLRSEDDKPQQALVTRPIAFGDSVLAGSFNVPPKTVAGDSLALAFAVANQGTQGLRGLRVRMTVPKGFTPISASGTGLMPLPGGEEWEQPLGDLAAGASGTVRLVGNFAAGSAGDVPLQARIGVPKPDGSFLPLLVSTSTLTVLAGDLGLHLVANGGDSDRTVQPGDPLRVTLEYRNLSPEPLSGVRLVLSFESLIDGQSATGTSLIDWRHVEDAGHGTTSTKTRIQTIVYDKDTFPAFAQLLPQEEGTIDITLPTFLTASGTKDAAIRIGLEGSLAKVGRDKSTRLIRTTPIVLRYRSDTTLASEARYFTEEGAPIGTGPLPPVVGKTTTYRIFWSVTKTLHALEGLDVSATLPASVAFGENRDAQAGELTYDPGTRVVRWKLNRMPDGVNALEASFEVQLTPGDLDANRFADLLGETKLSANDEALSEPLIRAVPPLTTDLTNDDGAKNKGVVRKR